MAELIEDCLHIIFGYLTPVEWIQISEVCQLWKTVVQKQWQKLNQITYFDRELGEAICRGSRIPLVRLASKDAEKFVHHVAESCNVVAGSTFSKKFIISLKVPFKYVLTGYTFDRFLQQLAKNAANIEELQFSKAPKMKSLQRLFKSNKIKKLKCHDCTQFWPHVPTDGIQTLEVIFKDPDDDFISFEGYFPNLQNLQLGIHNVEKDCNLELLLSRTLPYVRGIKSLELYIEAFDPPDYILLNEVVNFSQLEEFSIKFIWPNSFFFGGYDTYPNFDEQFKATSFSKLRVLALRNLSVSVRALKSMLELPNLEKLEVAELTNGFSDIEELPEMSKLTEFTIRFPKSSTVNLKNLSNAVKMMPKLQTFCVRGITEEQTLTLICEVTILAALQEKDVIVEQCSKFEDDFEYEKLLKIENPRNDQSSVQILCLRFINISKGHFFSSITRLVQKQLKGYHVLKLEDF